MLRYKGHVPIVMDPVLNVEDAWLKLPYRFLF